MIKNVIFDIGKVLVSFQWQDFLRDIGIKGDAYDKISANIFEKVWEEMDAEACDEDEMRRRSVEVVPEYPNEVNRIYDNLYHISSQFSYSSKWLQDVGNSGRKVYLLSNFGKFPFETLSPKYDFLKYVDGKVISYEIKKVKPDRAIYEFLLEKYDLIAEESVFIDDRPENVKMAEELGIKGIVFTSYEDARRELDDMME